MCDKLMAQDYRSTSEIVKEPAEYTPHREGRVKHVIQENQDATFVENVKVLQRILRGRAYQTIVRKTTIIATPRFIMVVE